MANLHCDFSSEVLGMNTAINVVLPEHTDLATVPVIFLFHGLMDNCSGWMRYTSVERYVRPYNAALIIPEVQRSYYVDMAYGLDYFTYVSEELPKITRTFFGFSTDRSLNYVCGLSMGGYAALKCAMTHPERYHGCAAFSAVADMKTRVSLSTGADRKEYTAIFGEELEVKDRDDLFALVEKADSKIMPSFITYCGEQDALFKSNSKLASKMQERGIKEQFFHWNGNHDWIFWDAAVKDAVERLLGGT